MQISTFLDHVPPIDIDMVDEAEPVQTQKEWHSPDASQRSASSLVATPSGSGPPACSSLCPLNLILPSRSSFSSDPLIDSTSTDAHLKSSTPLPIATASSSDLPTVSSSDLSTASSSDLPTASGIYCSVTCGASSSEPDVNPGAPLPSTPVTDAFYSQSEASSGSVARKCICDYSQLATRVQELEQKMDMLITQRSRRTPTHSTPKRPSFHHGGSAQKGEHLQKGQMSEAFYGKFSLCLFFFHSGIGKLILSLLQRGFLWNLRSSAWGHGQEGKTGTTHARHVATRCDSASTCLLAAVVLPGITTSDSSSR